MFSIHSTTSSRELVFSENRGEDFRVELKGMDVSAQTDVWDMDKGAGLYKLLHELASYDKPWPGEKSWGSYEGELSISATCSVTGTVIFYIQMSGFPGGAEEWHVSAGLTSEFGQMRQFAQAAKIFFKVPNG